MRQNYTSNDFNRYNTFSSKLLFSLCLFDSLKMKKKNWI